ncbi:Peptide-N4-(N-acetyl-beta-glucosaminyl)asparagine amidase A [Lachnellula suecica]|uniref:Peptide-N4-(N-acetyl-beta-glucosaminyl)asparagine amidase A n=1 Tax=Lachnellula suecica TaxID=602035 RepID=A0A8T9C6K9_9HELO|nr:Peptide-N4-(N-acetyl-beta-glucosaminyl)asparagine amidase A [Lachnellula suecica]
MRLSEYVNIFPENPGWLYGYSPFREIQLLIDGSLAGVSWPFPLLFTGGVDPGLWRPIVGIGAYDLPALEIDIGPWLPFLCDGNSHTFELKVVGFDSGAAGKIGTVGQNWYVTGAVFIWLDENSNQTTGTELKSTTPLLSFDFQPQVTSSNGTNSTFYFQLLAQRTLSLSSTIYTSSGAKNNIQNMTVSAYNQSLSMNSQGSFSDSSSLLTSYSYPINLYSAYVIAPSSSTLSSVFTLIDRSFVMKGRDILSYLTGTSTEEALQTRQLGSSMYYWNETIVEGTVADTGVTEQWLSYSGNPGFEDGPKNFSRHSREVNNSLVLDKEDWRVMAVPNTIPLPFVDGEPVV